MLMHHLNHDYNDYFLSYLTLSTYRGYKRFVIICFEKNIGLGYDDMKTMVFNFNLIRLIYLFKLYII